jgi:hypothetical protein
VTWRAFALAAGAAAGAALAGDSWPLLRSFRTTNSDGGQNNTTAVSRTPLLIVTFTLLLLAIVATAAGTLLTANVSHVAAIQETRRTRNVEDFLVSLGVSIEGDAAAKSAGPEMAAVHGVIAVDSVSRRTVTVDGHSVTVIARDFPRDDFVTSGTAEADTVTLREYLLRGHVAIGSELAKRARLNAGDEIMLSTLEGPRRFPIAAVVGERTDSELMGGLVIYVHRQTAQSLLGIDAIYEYIVRVDAAARDEVKARLRPICAKYSMTVRSLSTIQRMVDDAVSRVLGSSWVLRMLGIVVGVVGLANALGVGALAYLPGRPTGPKKSSASP